MKNRRCIIVIIVLVSCLALGSLAASGADTKKIVVGAKDFTEQYVFIL